MDSTGLRRRSERLLHLTSASSEDLSSSASGNSDEPPRYTVDLSLPPRKRYQHIAADFKPQIATLPALFDEVVQDLRANVSVERVRWLARLLLRRVYSKEESEELRGIQEVTGIEMYLLVAFNVLLDRNVLSGIASHLSTPPNSYLCLEMLTLNCTSFHGLHERGGESKIWTNSTFSHTGLGYGRFEEGHCAHRFRQKRRGHCTSFRNHCPWTCLGKSFSRNQIKR